MRVERRSHSISEAIQRPDPKLLELNSKKTESPAELEARLYAKIVKARDTVWREQSTHPESPHEDANLRLCLEEGDDWWSDEFRRT